jgi:septal ring factor EnvC (AmiA/AmiB activator)
MKSHNVLEQFEMEILPKLKNNFYFKQCFLGIFIAFFFLKLPFLAYGQSKDAFAEMTKNLKTLELTITETTTELSTLNQDILATKNELAALDQRQQQYENAMLRQHQALMMMIRLGYAFEQNDPVKIVLNQQDSSKLDRYLQYEKILNEARLQAVHELQNNISNLKQTRVVLQAKSIQLAGQQQQLKLKKNRLENLRLQKRRLLAKETPINLNKSAIATSLPLKNLSPEQTIIENSTPQTQSPSPDQQDFF